MIGFVAKLFGGSTVSAWVLVVVVGVVGGYIGVLKFDNWRLGNQIESQRLEIKELELNVAHEKGEVKACKARIDETNARIDDLKEDRKDRQAMFEALRGTFDDIRSDTRDEIDALDNLPTPQNCEDAMRLLRDGLGEQR